MVFKKTNLVLDKKIDAKTRRHYINGCNVVLHCHHYSTLYTQLALDAEETQLLQDVAEEIFYEQLLNAFEAEKAAHAEEKVELAKQYYASMGLGKIEINYIGKNSASIEMPYSHVDSGWIKKWGNHNKPVNYIGAGYCCALLAALNGDEIGTYSAFEIESIAMGAEKCIFKIVKG